MNGRLDKRSIARITFERIYEEELARRLGVSRQFLSSVELSHTHVGIEVAKRIADALGYSPEPFAEILVREQMKKAGISCYVSLKPRPAA